MSHEPVNSTCHRQLLQKLGGCGGKRCSDLAGAGSQTQRVSKRWEPVSERRVRLGIVGYRETGWMEQTGHHARGTAKQMHRVSAGSVR